MSTITRDVAGRMECQPELSCFPKLSRSGHAHRYDLDGSIAADRGYRARQAKAARPASSIQGKRYTTSAGSASRQLPAIEKISVADAISLTRRMSRASRSTYSRRTVIATRSRPKNASFKQRILYNFPNAKIFLEEFAG